MLPACYAPHGDGELLCCTSWTWMRNNGFTALLGSNEVLWFVVLLLSASVHVIL